MNSILFATLLFIAITEISLLISWNHIFLKFGIPVFFKKIKVETHDIKNTIKNLIDLCELNNDKYVYKEIEDGVLAVRNSFSLSSPNPVIRGLVVFKRKDNTIIIYGYIYYTVLAILLYIIIELGLFVMPFCAIIIGIPFFRNIRILKDICTGITEAISTD